MRSLTKKLLTAFLGPDALMNLSNKRRLSRYTESTFDKILKEICSLENTVIFDVGANTGQSIIRFSRIFPDNPTIHSFEPITKLADRMKQEFSGHANITVNNFALGAQKKKETFFQAMKPDCSSFNKIDPDSSWAKEKGRRHGVDVNDFTVKEIEAEIQSLDSYVEEHRIERINLLKIDTQGYEDEVLKGAVDSLNDQKVDVIEAELIVGNAYEKRLSFNEIENLVYPYGYRFFGINTAGNILDTPELSFDVLYVKSEIFERFK